MPCFFNNLEEARGGVVRRVGQKLRFVASIGQQKFHRVKYVIGQRVGVAFQASTNQADPHKITRCRSAILGSESPKAQRMYSRTASKNSAASLGSTETCEVTFHAP